MDAVADGGGNDENNLAASCTECNSAKHKTPILLFLAGRAIGISRFSPDVTYYRARPMFAHRYDTAVERHEIARSAFLEEYYRGL